MGSWRPVALAVLVCQCALAAAASAPEPTPKEPAPAAVPLFGRFETRILNPKPYANPFRDVNGEQIRRGAWGVVLAGGIVSYAEQFDQIYGIGSGFPYVEMHQSPRKRVLVYLNRGEGAKWSRQVVAVTGSHNLCVADLGKRGTPSLIGANWSGPYQPLEVWQPAGAPPP